MLNLNKINSFIGYNLLLGLFLTLISCGGMSEQQMLQSAKKYIEQGDLKAASLELRNTLQGNKKNFEARFLLGNINMKIGDYEAALKEFQRAYDGGWNKEKIQLARAKIFFNQRKLQQLLDEIKIDNTWSVETRANILGLRALAEAGLGNDPQAKFMLDKAISLKEDALYVLKAKAIFQLSGLLNGAPDKTIKEALVLYPDNIELLFLQAMLYVKNDNLPQASSTYKKITRLDPPNLTTPYSRQAVMGLARIQISQQNFTEATTTLNDALAKNENNPEANFLSALIANSEQKYDRAETYLQKLLATLPDHKPALLLLGKVKYATKDYEQASQNIIKYLNAAPGDTDAQKLLAQTYIFLKQPDKAQNIIHSLLVYNADDAIALRLQSQIQFTQGDTNASIKTLLKAIKLKPRDISLRNQLIKTYIALGETAKALNEIKTFKKLSGDTKTAQQLTISAYMQAGQTEKAINIAEEILKNNPLNIEALTLNGVLHTANKNNTQARKYFIKALLQQDKYLPATMALALIERHEGHLDKATSLYTGLVESGIGNATPMLALAEIANQESRENDMLNWLEKSRGTSANEIKSRIILANHYLKINQPKKANIYIQEVYKILPGNPKVLTLVSKVLLAQNRYKEALPPLKNLVTQQPDSIEAHILLGEAYLGNRKIMLARKQLLIALKMNAKHLQALSFLAKTELEDRKYNKSLEYSNKIQKTYPKSSIGFIYAGDAWMAKKKFKKARLAYSKAWKTQQTATAAIKSFNATIKIVSFKKAIDPVLLWLQKNPDDYVTRTFLASQYLESQQNENAIREYKKLLAKQPDNVATLNNLAWLYHLKNDPKALDMAEQAYRIEAASPGVQDTYGWILVHKNETEKGKRLIRNALKQLPNNPDVKYHYAVALIKTDEKQKGKQLLEDTLKQNKSFSSRDDAQKLLDTL
ncbi:hypothetical protein MNBD_GAMMA06-582 [hydrothermal vent metagenome]|uniref:Uncharacterized protein n=1 Tax=hydrothermal vent metagenome TaxID=652676 RepID=A0A3B0WHG3_9ZZZZ